MPAGGKGDIHFCESKEMDLAGFFFFMSYILIIL